MSDNPFSEPDDAERTVIRPAPGGSGGRRTAPAAAAAGSGPRRRRRAASRRRRPPPATAPKRSAIGVNPLVAGGRAAAAAAGAAAEHAQPSGSRRAARARGARDPHLRAAARASRRAARAARRRRITRCAPASTTSSLNTPWGSTGVLGQPDSLVSIFHKEVRSGERLLPAARRSCGRTRALPAGLELMYLCMSLGFQGQYRLSPRGRRELDRLREELYAIIVRQRQAPEPALSPHWQGVAAPYRGRAPCVPIWVMARRRAGGAWRIVRLVLDRRSTPPPTSCSRSCSEPRRRTMPQIIRAAPVRPPPPPPQRRTAQPTALCTLPRSPRSTRVWSRCVGSRADPDRRACATAACSPPAAPTVEPALRAAAGAHRRGAEGRAGPDQVVRLYRQPADPDRAVPVQFPAVAARAPRPRGRSSPARSAIPARIAAEGRADADPLAANATPEGREQNRRIEVVLRRQG